MENNVESVTQPGAHELLATKLEVETEAARRFIGSGFSGETYENWLLEYCDILHEIVEDSKIKDKVAELAGLEATDPAKQVVKEETIGMILSGLKKNNKALAA